jgi:hypothetical protein
MTGRSKSRNRSRRHNRSRMSRRSQQGGSQGAYPDSAWGFQMNNLGNGWTQFMNSLSVQPGQNMGTSQSNSIVPVRNINAEDPKSMMMSSKGMSGGKKRGKRNMMRMMQQQQMMGQQRMMGQSKSQSRSKKGGYWGAVLEQAAVPLALLGMQQAYGKRHTRRNEMSHKRTFKRRR